MSESSNASYRCCDCEYTSKPDKPFDLVVWCDLRKTNVHLSQSACSSFGLGLIQMLEYLRVIINAIATMIERKNNV